MTNGSATEVAFAARDLSKRYPGVQALSNIGLTLRRGEIVGLVGENGAGKSTLLSILNGRVKPDAGTLEVGGRTVPFGNPAESASRGIATVYQEIQQGIVPTLPVYENMFLGREARFLALGFVKRAALIETAQRTLDGLGMSLSARAYTGNLSYSELQQVEIAKAFAIAEAFDVAPIILLDEPTTALSEHETQNLMDNMRQWRERASFVFVSHRLAHVFSICDRLTALKDGRIVAGVAVDEIDEAGLHELIVGRKRESEYYKESRQREPETDVLLRAESLSRKGAYSDVSFEVRAGEIVGVAGVAGGGKSEVARTVVGLERYDQGEVQLCGSRLPSGSLAEAIRRGAAYVPADRHREGIIVQDSVTNNVTLPLLAQLRMTRLRLISPSASRRVVHSWVERLNIKVADVTAPARTLSGGNQQKAVFAKWLAKGVKLLVLDDPGRGLDVGAKEEIYTLMRDLVDDGVGILVVSDNLPELIGLSNRIIVMRGGQITAEISAPTDAKPSESDVVRHMV